MFYRVGQPAPKPQENTKYSSTQVQTERTSTTSAEGSFKRKAKKESVSRGTKSSKEKPLAAESEKKKEQGESSFVQKTKSMKMVPLVRPFPKVYIRTMRRNIVAREKSKAQVFTEILEVHEQKQEDQPLDSDEEILNEAGYTRTSKNIKEELKLVVGTRMHTREKKKY